MAVSSKAEMLELDVAARLELIEELWDSIAADSHAADQVPLSDEERRLLDARLNEYRANPSTDRPWPEVRAEILKQR